MTIHPKIFVPCDTVISIFSLTGNTTGCFNGLITVTSVKTIIRIMKHKAIRFRNDHAATSARTGIWSIRWKTTGD